MRVLVGCEESQAVTIEFRKFGHEAFSCDIQECSGGHPEWHLQMDVFKAIALKSWDMGIFFPECTYLTNAGIRWFNEERYGEKAILRKQKRDEALIFVENLYNCKIPMVCIENPVGWLNSHFRKPDQIIQPYWFGDPESKRTCLWLKGLPKLQRTHFDVEPKVYGRFKKGIKKGQPIYGTQYCKFMEDRAKIRSKTFPGVARVMREQWGYLNFMGVI